MRPTARQVVALLCVGILVVPGTAVAVVRGSPDLSVSVAEDTVTPGSNTELRLTLTNEGEVESGSASNPSLAATVTTARGVDVSLDANGAPIDVETGTRSLGRLGQGGQATLGYQLSVDEDAAPGTYTMEATVDYRYTSSIAESNGARNHDTETRTFDVTVEIDDRARFEVVDTTANVRAGSTGSVDVTMRNVGSETAAETTVALASENADVTVGEASSASRFVGDWAPDETRTVTYEVGATAAEHQRYALTATASFEDADGVTRESEALPLGIEPRPEQQFHVVDTASTVAVGDTGTVSLTVENAGSVPVSDATVTLQSDSPDVVFGESASATRFVGEWAPGETRTVEYDATATGAADTRRYALTATVAYEDPTHDEGRSRDISVGLTPEPEQGFSLSNVSTDLRVGQEGTVRGTVTNEGTSVARNVVIQFTAGNGSVSPLETEYSVGTLRAGESAPVAFDAEVSRTATPGPRQFSFVATYRNSEGEPRRSDDLLTRQHVGPGGDAFTVEAVDATYAPGEGGALTVQVTNSANETVSDVSANLFADDPVAVDDGEAFVAELAPGESTTMTFGVSTDGDALSKTYPVSVDLRYEDSDGDAHVSDSHRVAVAVAESDEESGGGLPLTAVGLGAAGLVGVGAVVRYRS